MFNIKINSLEQEFERVIDTIKSIPFFMDNYGEIIARLPENDDKTEPAFLHEMKDIILSKVETRYMKERYGVGIISDIDKDRFLEAFKPYYHPEVLQNMKNDIETDFKKYSQTINVNRIFTTLNKNWNFKLPNSYDINLCYYGTGGSYHCKTNSMDIRYERQLTKPYFYTIFHEAIHIGIEENIIAKYGLKQIEKECVVDAMCSAFLPNYRQQTCTEGVELYNFLVSNRDRIETELPKLIGEYKNLVCSTEPPKTTPSRNG